VLRVGLGDLALEKPLHLWINDGLMAVFFLVVGLEIKREVLIGELASPRRAVLPVSAAIGGAIVPAVLFVIVAGGDPEAARGWGVPMATDIAFALGVLALVGSRIPIGLRVFLTALAIVDDLIAVLVIALFYASGTSWAALAVAAAVLAGLVVVNRLGVRRPLVYAVLGGALWLAVLQSGVHATVAGVLLAMTIPARTRIDRPEFLQRARGLLASFERRADEPADERHHAELWELEELAEHAQSPTLRIEHALHPWAAYLIVPIFALANAGVSISGSVEQAAGGVAFGIVVGLVVGKQIGITLAAFVVVRLGLAALPDGVGWREIYGAAWLGGIGFTMSLFVADLAFGDSAVLGVAKVGILAASIVAGVGGYVVLRRSGSASA
jgi:NhaA family Na+:H+ antiporter